MSQRKTNRTRAQQPAESTSEATPTAAVATSEAAMATSDQPTTTPSFADFTATLSIEQPGVPEIDPSDIAPWASADASLETSGTPAPDWRQVPLAPPARGAGPVTPQWSFQSSDAAAVSEASVPSRDEAAPPPVHNDPSVPPASPLGLPTFGPMGKPRSPLAVVILSIVTLGLYGLIWHGRTNREMADFDPRMHVRPSQSTWAVAVPWLAGLLVTLAGGGRLLADALHISPPFDPGFTIAQAWFLLPALFAAPYLTLVLPFSVTAVTMTAERIRILEERVGMTTDVQLRPARAAAWLVLPIVGSVSLRVREQRRLNAVWERVAPPASTRRRR